MAFHLRERCRRRRRIGGDETPVQSKGALDVNSELRLAFSGWTEP